MKLYILSIYLLTATIAVAGSLSPNQKNPTTALSLRDVLELVLAQNPELAAFDSEVRAADARILQARLLPNPELGAEVENVGGSGEFSGTDSAEGTLQLSQLIELGGKRKARARVATRDKELTVWDYEEQRLRILTEAAQAFIDVLASQRRVELVQQTVKLAEEFLSASAKRVEAGRASTAEKTRSEIAASSSRIELEQAQRALLAARESLVSYWGERTPRFSRVKGDLDHTEPAPPSATELASRLKDNPQVSRYPTEIQQREAQVDFERAQASPDITVSAGYRRFAATDDNAAVVGFSIPLPFFDRNQGRIREAQIQLEKTQQLQDATAVRLDAELDRVYQALLASQREIATLETKILPFSQEAYDTIDDGYKAGRFSFLELLDARRTLTSARLQLLSAKQTYHHAVTEIESLTGRRPNLHLD